MREPKFVDRAALEGLHEKSLARYGGSDGVRDEDGILSALGAAQNTWFYGQKDVFEVAAAYAFHIAQAQGFVDGNKRAALAAALVFLSRNNVEVGRRAGYGTRLYDAMIAIAEKRLDKAGLAALFRELFA